ncbi:MAG TPA: 16S rRNA (guanine(966)-N(2))-methyltransferase RsmD [Chlamydiales bacterium]|nr:16S rRNA (guanine(966)-N(2))-methyltransferase RsmD [Chlamydiales bacterium]
MSLRIIAGTFKGRLLKAPKGPSTRPTQGMLREAVFNICQNDIGNARFLDLYAGSGAMGLEALSRGAAHATLVEQNRHAIACIKENIAALHLESQAALIPFDANRALTLLTKQGALFDILYVDPPYDSPVPLEPLVPLLAPHATLFIEERYNPKKPHQPPTHASLHHKETRRFGIALLSIFRAF